MGINNRIKLTKPQFIPSILMTATLKKYIYKMNIPDSDICDFYDQQDGQVNMISDSMRICDLTEFPPLYFTESNSLVYFTRNIRSVWPSG